MLLEHDDDVNKVYDDWIVSRYYSNIKEWAIVLVKRNDHNNWFSFIGQQPRAQPQEVIKKSHSS